MSKHDAGKHWELFLDDHVIERSTGFQRVLHHPQPRGVVVPADKPWEPQGLTPVYVGRRDDGQFECYYRAHGLVDEEIGEFVGYALSERLIDQAQQAGAPKHWAGNSVWALLFTFGGLANLAYCGYLFTKNRSLEAYGDKHSWRNLLLVAAMSAMWMGSFVLYGVGARMLGDWGPIVGWSLYVPAGWS